MNNFNVSTSTLNRLNWVDEHSCDFAFPSNYDFSVAKIEDSFRLVEPWSTPAIESLIFENDFRLCDALVTESYESFETQVYENEPKIEIYHNNNNEDTFENFELNRCKNQDTFENFELNRDINEDMNNWKAGDTVEFKRPAFVKLQLDQKYKNFTEIEFFELFFDYDIRNFIMEKSVGFAKKCERQFKMNDNEFKVFIAIILISGYLMPATRGMYWENNSDTRNLSVYSSMRRERFSNIMKYFSIGDTQSKTQLDRYSYMSEFTNILQNKFLRYYNPDKSICLMDIKIPGKGRINSLNTSYGHVVISCIGERGYTLNFRVVANIDLQINMEHRQKIIMSMIHQFPPRMKYQPYNIYFGAKILDISLINKLRKLDYGASAIITNNDIPALPPILLAANKANSCKFISAVNEDNSIIICRQHIKPTATIISNVNGCLPIAETSKELHGHGIKRYPYLLFKHKKYVGSALRHIDVIRCYKTKSHSNGKWWWPVFTWLLDVCLHNAWVMYSSYGNTCSALDFRRRIVLEYTQKFGVLPKGSGRQATKEKGNKRVSTDIRYDGSHHYLIRTESQKRRRCAGQQCKKIPVSECCKCKVGLCLDCNLHYHKQNSIK